MTTTLRTKLHRAAERPNGIDSNGVSLTKLLGRAPTGVAFLSGPDHRFCYVNDHYVRAVGRSDTEDLLGLPVREALPELQGTEIPQILDDVGRTGSAHCRSDFKLAVRNSVSLPQDKYLDFIFQPTFDSTGRVEGIFVLALDLTDRVLGRHAVEEREERLRLAHEAAQIATWEWDPVEKTRLLSMEIHQLYGTDPEASHEEAYRVWASHVFATDRPVVEQEMTDCQRTGVLDVEYRYEHPSMGLRHHHTKGRRMKGTSRFYCVVSDITNRKQRERWVDGDEFRRLADAMPQLVWIANADGSADWFNQRWYDYTGTTAEQNRGWGWQSMHDPRFLPDVMERWRTSLRTAEPFEMVFPLRDRDGGYKAFLTRAVPIRDSKGSVRRWFGTNTDISNEFEIRQQIEVSQAKLQASLDSSQRLAAIVESSDDAIIGKDLNGVITSWNPCAERMFGFKAGEMIGQSIKKIIPADVFADEDHIMSAVARGERTEHFETVRCRKDGECFEVSLTLSPVLNEAGKISGVASISRDISQQKKVEKALHTSERLASVGRLAATIAHEINNPLEAVTNLVFLAQNRMQDADGKVFLDQAQQELARVALLTKQTLGFYRENKGARMIRLEELVTPLVSVFSARARNKRISIETEIRQNPEVMAIPGEIRQLFANLLNNSIDAVRDRGRIMVRISAARERGARKRAGVRLTVCDDGPGISLELRKKLSEPFFTTKQDVGTVSCASMTGVSSYAAASFRGRAGWCFRCSSR